MTELIECTENFNAYNLFRRGVPVEKDNGHRPDKLAYLALIVLHYWPSQSTYDD